MTAAISVGAAIGRYTAMTCLARGSLGTRGLQFSQLDTGPSQVRSRNVTRWSLPCTSEDVEAKPEPTRRICRSFAASVQRTAPTECHQCNTQGLQAPGAA